MFSLSLSLHLSTPYLYTFLCSAAQGELRKRGVGEGDDLVAYSQSLTESLRRTRSIAIFQLRIECSDVCFEWWYGVNANRRHGNRARKKCERNEAPGGFHGNSQGHGTHLHQNSTWIFFLNYVFVPHHHDLSSAGQGVPHDGRRPWDRYLFLFDDNKSITCIHFPTIPPSLSFDFIDCI